MRAIVIGSTGLVGGHLLSRLEKHPAVTEVVALVRTPRKSDKPKVKFVQFDFDRMDSDLLKGDLLFCALGTTIKKAGSKEAQYKVDYHYNANAARLAKQQGVKVLAHVSSIGADSRSSNFYLKTKGELEKTMEALQFEKSVIARPSIIMGDRQEFRLGEKIGILMAGLFSPLMIGGLKKYKGVHAAKIATALVTEAFNNNWSGYKLIESDAIQNYDA